jgi:hypothetical protein
MQAIAGAGSASADDLCHETAGLLASLRLTPGLPRPFDGTIHNSTAAAGRPSTPECSTAIRSRWRRQPSSQCLLAPDRRPHCSYLAERPHCRTIPRSSCSRTVTTFGGSRYNNQIALYARPWAPCLPVANGEIVPSSARCSASAHVELTNDFKGGLRALLTAIQVSLHCECDSVWRD